jgi:hypothetical protein
MPPKVRSLALPCLILAMAVVIGGCSSRATMEELEKEALQTGDWSAVEQRQRIDREMGRVDPERECPSGESLLCQQKGEKEECQCVSSHLLRSDRQRDIY